MDEATPQSSPLRRFYIIREKDYSGVAGIGRIVEGVLFPDGRCVLQWRKPISSLVLFESLDELLKIYLHAHHGCNRLVFVDPESAA